MGNDGFSTAIFQQLIDDGVLEIGDGYRAKNDELGGSGPIFLRAGHMTDTHIGFEGVERFHAELEDRVRPKMSRLGDTIITTKGNSTGRTSFVTDRMPPFVYSPHLSYWRSLDPNRIENGFLRYWARGREFQRQLTGMKASTDMAPYLSLTDQRRLKITLPPPHKQKAITHILGTLDDKIELNRRMNETLEAIARAIFKSWFVYFDPVKAKAAGATSFPTMPQPVFDTLPTEFTDSPLGPVPKGWRIGKLSDLCSTQYGYTASANDDPIGPKFLRVKDINKRNWIEWPEVPHCEIDDKTWPKYQLNIGDVVVARMADPGKSAIIEDDIDAVFASYLVRLKTVSLAHAYFVYGFLKSRLYEEYAAGARSGSVQSNMNARVIVAADFVIPPGGLLEALLDRVLPLRKKLAANVRESSTLATIRDTLLPKLLSGEIRVGTAEKVVEEVA